MAPNERSPRMPRAVTPRHWEAVVAILAVATAYAFISATLRLGPFWLIPFVIGVLLLLRFVARRRGRHDLAHGFGLTSAGLASAAVGVSVGILLVRLVDNRLAASELLRDGAILWACNVVVFALWYWELDGGGPTRRHTLGYEATDFLFPRTAIGGDLLAGWHPHFIDYLFVAFTTSSAFGPTDTLPLSGRAKLLMMAQALMSMATVVVLISRAINMLQ